MAYVKSVPSNGIHKSPPNPGGGGGSYVTMIGGSLSSPIVVQAENL